MKENNQEKVRTLKEIKYFFNIAEINLKGEQKNENDKW